MSGKGKKEIESLKKDLLKFDHAYYVLNDPLISDREYDLLLTQLKDLEKNNPGLITPDSPTQRVSGIPVSTFGQIKHRFPMLSLDNSYSSEDIESWVTRISKGLDSKSVEFVLNPKIDGLSLSLYYKEGIFEKAATRGDGQLGEDVTLNARTIKAIPLKLRKPYPAEVEIRGEVYIEKKDFKKMNDVLLAKGETPFANARNAGSGSLRQKDPKITSLRPLKFFAHSSADPSGLKVKTYLAFLEECQQWGIPVAHPYKKEGSVKGILETCFQWQEQRNQWNFEADGVVIRLNQYSDHKKLGATAKAPRWAVAYKFPAAQATTRILKVEPSVGRTGVVTPTAQLEPIECGGVTISNASLHNYDEVARLGVKVGDTIFIERAGEVIPKVIKVVKEKRNGKEISVKAPTYCPSCQTKLVKKPGEVAIRCPNSSCPVQVERRILHFASRDALDIEGMGEAVVQQLVKGKNLTDVADIYSLEKEDFLEFDLFKEKRAQNLITAIQKSKNQPLEKFIYALGIPNIGEKAALTLAEQFGSFSALAHSKEDQLLQIPDIGPIVAESVTTYFSIPENQKTIEKLKSHGINPQKEKPQIPQSGEFLGKSVVFTGELKQMSRSDAEKFIRQVGGKAVGSVSKKTDFVVVGENPGSKYTKATALHIPILTEAAFLAKIKKVF